MKDLNLYHETSVLLKLSWVIVWNGKQNELHK